jgi:protoheme IX farnesyltransferase
MRLAQRPAPSGVVPAALPEREGVGSALRPYWELTKPGITRLVLITTGVGFYLGSAAGPDLLLLLNTLFGTALAASGANALNQVVERKADALMRRTANRPLPSGRLGMAEALVFATAVSFIGCVHLFFLVNPLTSGVVAASLLSYVLIYTPLKRRTWWATLIGAVPGALPALAGWTAATDAIGPGGLALFAIIFVWQMPHFFALGWMYREDYERGGFRMLSSLDPAGSRTARLTVLYTIALLPISLLPTFFGLTGWLYGAGAIALGAVFLGYCATLLADRARGRAHRVFIASILYLPALLALMVVDKV